VLISSRSPIRTKFITMIARLFALGAFMLCGPLRAADLSAAIAACGQYRYREAVKMIDAIPSGKITAEALRYRGVALGKMGRWEEANATLERARAMEPDSVDVLLDLANAQGQYALASGPFGKLSGARKAKATLEQAVALAPNSVDARNGLYGFYLNVPAIVGGGRDKALAQLVEIERLDPVTARLCRAELAYADKDFARAFAIYREVQRTHPDDYRAYYGLGRIAALSGKELESGLASLRRCATMTSPLRLPGLPGVHLRMGDILRHKGDIAGARAAYQESLRVLPEYTFAREELAKLKKS